MSVRELTLDEVHQAELDLLALIDSFCTQHHLRYYLAYGTLLGAIRHDGFIPWDDDADVWMPREDYDRFLRLFEETDRYRLIQPFQPAYGFAWAKVLDKRTSYTHERFKMPDDYGLTIDVFPLDEDKGEDTYRVMQKRSRLRAIKWKTLKADGGAKGVARAFLKRVIPNSMVGDSGFRKAISKGSWNGRWVNYCSRYRYAQESTAVEVFGEGVRKQFEGEHAFVVPSKAIALIEQIYGPSWREPVVSTHPTQVYWREGYAPE